MQKYYAYFKEYDASEHDSIREITEEEYKKLNPWNNHYALGGSDNPPPDDVELLVWEDVYDRDAIDLRLSELDNWDFTTTVEIAIC